jgi:ABC-2 type transport system permease protein
MPELTLPHSAATPRRGLGELGELAVLIARAQRLSLRNVDGLSTAFALPVILMVMFVELFGGAIHTGGHYVDYVVPGVLLVCVGFGAGTTAVTVAADLTGSIIDRLRAMDVRGESLLAGHVVASVVRNILSSGLAVAVAYGLGFRSGASPLQWLAAIGILVLFVTAISWLAAAIGVAVRSAEAAQGVTFLVSFLPYPSSAFVPVSTMPSWLEPFAAHQPVTEVANAVRALLMGTSPGSSAWLAVVWSASILAGSVLLAGRLFRLRAG